MDSTQMCPVNEKKKGGNCSTILKLIEVLLSAALCIKTIWVSTAVQALWHEVFSNGLNASKFICYDR